MTQAPSVFRQIEARFGIAKLFQVGPFNRFDHAERVYTDRLGETSEQLSAKFGTHLERLAGDKQLLFLDIQYDNPAPILEAVRECGVDLGQPIGEVSFYLESDELTHNIYGFEVDLKSSILAAKGLLSRHLDEQPFHMAEVFVSSRALGVFLNVYDDQGYDIVFSDRND